MECVEARRLLDQGVVPGSSRGRNPYLGFHLASCAECRAYRQQGDQQLLSVLVAQPDLSPTPVAPVLHENTAAPPVAPTLHENTAVLPVAPALHENTLEMAGTTAIPPRRKSTFRLAASLMSAVLLLGLGYIGLKAYRVYGNIQSTNQSLIDGSNVAGGAGAVIVAQSLATATPTSLPATATATARPSSTALPTSTPTTAPTSTPEPTPTPSLPAARAMTILLLGIDARPGEGLNARSDAMMLVRLDPQTGDVALLSLPRDMWIAIPGVGQTRVNAAFYYGERGQPNGGGLALASQTMSAAFGIPIDHAVVIDFNGFRSLVDALGGITVDVPKEIYDGQYPTDDYGYKVAHFLPGAQQMDGETASMYARTRHPDSDFERIKRQQLVLLGIANRIKERGALQNLHEADTITQALAPFVHSNMPPDQVLSLLWSLRDADISKARRYTVDGSQLWETNVNGAYALVPQDGVLAALGQKLLHP